MKAVIMAGGEGSRLRPLTCDLPKPMARLLGRPMLEYILDLLGNHGVEQASLTLRYLPDKIVGHFPEGRYGNITLSFVEEDKPLGTAGSVRNACTEQDKDVLVISGDAMCDFDLSAFAAFHRTSGADVSIIGKKVADPREYGLIATDGQNGVTGFIEKPAFSQAISDIANTGIYLLSNRAVAMIPKDTAYDFAKDLFPRMLENGMRLGCWLGTGYWCDIGDLHTYITCQQDMLEGLVHCNIRGSRDAAGNIFAEESRAAGRLKISPPVYIGKNTRIDENAVLERGSVVDDGCCIGSGARISGCILLPSSHIGARARLTGALVCAGASVKDGAMLFEDATVGAGSIVGEHASVLAGVKIWNGKNIPASSVVAQHIKLGAPDRGRFDDDGLTGQVGVELTPELAARVGAAVGSRCAGQRVAVGSAVERSAGILKAALSAGVQSTGRDVLDFGENFQAFFSYCMNFSSSPVGVYIRGDGRASIRLMGRGGLPADRELERGVETALAAGEFARCPWEQVGERVEMNGFAMLYRSQLLRFAPKGLFGCRVHVKSRNMAVQNLMRDVLEKLGCDTAGGLQIELSSQGDKVRIYDATHGYVPHHKVLTFCAMSELERGVDVAVPFDAPRVIDRIATAANRRALRYFTCPADQSDKDARHLAIAQMWPNDGLMQAVMFLEAARRAGDIKALLQRAPEYDRAEATLETKDNPAGLLRDLEIRREGGIGEGVLVENERGVVLVRPLKRGTGLRIFAEARSSETADELCADMEVLLRKKQQKQSGAHS